MPRVCPARFVLLPGDPVGLSNNRWNGNPSAFCLLLHNVAQRQIVSVGEQHCSRMTHGCCT